jgi:hypothetical protein
MAEFEGKGIVFFEFSNFGRNPKGSGYPLQSFGKPKRIFAPIPCAKCCKEVLFENGNPFTIVSLDSIKRVNRQETIPYFP